jgi:hypothetical protein
MKKLLLILILLISLQLLLSQENIFTRPSFNGDLSSNSLLNPYKLKMTHSVGFMAGTSSNGLGFYESRYTNLINYEFNPKLSLALDLNFVNFGSITSSKNFSIESNEDNKTKIQPEFSLTYKPTDSISINIGYRNYNNYYNPWMGHSPDWME